MIKQKLLKSQKFLEIYDFEQKTVRKFLNCISPKIASKYIYKKVFGRKLNLKCPKTFNEKLMWLKLKKYKDNPLIIKCADKYLVREYVKEKGCGEILNDLIGVWDSVEDIPWNKLPEKFAIKCNHGSGYNIVCKDKFKFNIKDAEDKLRKWMNQDYGTTSAETVIYRGIQKKIICEKYIETEDGKPPKDYKFFCVYGEPKFLFVASDRIDDDTKFDYYTMDWEWIPVKNAHPNCGPQTKPEGFNLMIQYASILSKDFPLVRVDFYSEYGNVIFGELTFTHFACLHKFEPDEYDYEFGEMIPFEIISQ